VHCGVPRVGFELGSVAVESVDAVVTLRGTQVPRGMELAWRGGEGDRETRGEGGNVELML